MDLDQNPDELLEQEEGALERGQSDKALDVSPFDKQKGNNSNKPEGSKLPGKKSDSKSGGALNKLKSGANKAAAVKNGKEGLKEEAKKKAEDKAEKLAEQALKKAGPYGRAAYVGKKALEKIGIKIKIGNPKILFGIIAGVIAMFMVPIIVMYFMVMTIWDHPTEVLGLGWDAAKMALNLSMESTIKSGGAGKFAYEYDVNKGGPTAVAAPNANKPKEGTLAYKYGLIDWEKAKYQTVENDTNCLVNTKEVESAIDGKKRYVINSVTLRRTPSGDLGGTARSLCINKVYPTFNTIMRSKFLRTGINRELAVRFAYAEPKDAKTIKGKSQEETNKVLRDKTLKRIWNANLKSTLDSAAQKKAAEAAAAAAAAQAQPSQGAGGSMSSAERAHADELIKQRDSLKNPCEGRSLSACENSASEDQAKLLDVNVKIIDALHPKYKDKINPNDTIGGDYFALKSKVDKNCTNAFHIPMPCQERIDLQTAANKYAERLVALYKKDGSSAGSQTPSPAAAAPAGTNSTQNNGWPTTCQENFEPTQGDDVDKAIANAVNDLLCGINPKSIHLKGVKLPDEKKLANIGEGKGAEVDAIKASSMSLLCEFSTRLLTNDNYKNVARYRIASAANAAWQSITYSHTFRNRYLGLNEVSGDFYKIASFNESQEYHVPINNDTGGNPLEVMATGDMTGASRSNPDDRLPGAEEGVAEELYREFVSDAKGAGICKQLKDNSNQIYGAYGAPDSNVFNKVFAAFGFVTIRQVTAAYDGPYQHLKQQMATLPYYSKNNSNSIEESKDIYLNDILLYIVKMASNTSDSGTEAGPQNFNRMSLGMKAYMNAYSVAMGGQFLRSEQSIAIETQTENNRRAEEKTRGIAYRLFNNDNPRSLVSKLSADTVANPTTAIKNVASTLLSLFNPIDSLVSGRKSLVYYVTGENNTALAASDYDRNNLRLDPAGMPDEMLRIDPLNNAEEIEGLEESDNAEIKQMFSAWDTCFKKFIPTEQLHLNVDNPECIILFTSNKELQRDYTGNDIIAKAKQADFGFLKPIADNIETLAKNDAKIRNKTVWPYSLAMKYRLYHYNNLQADALIYLSDPEKEDESLNASSDKNDKSTPAGTSLDGVQCPAQMEEGASGYVKMPEAPNGEYVIYSSEARRYGSKELVCVLYTVGLNYNQAMQGKSKLRIGDLNGGNPHKSHKWGVAVDVSGGGELAAANHTSTAIGKYDTQATITLGKLFIDTGQIRNLWWCPNDNSGDELINYAQSKGTPMESSKCISGHESHFHWDIKAEYKGPEYAP